MKKIDLNDLPRWCVHARRLLRGDPSITPKRTLESVRQEYDQGTYGLCLEHLNKLGPDATIEGIRQYQLRIGVSVETQCGDVPTPAGLAQTRCVSLGNDLFEMALDEAQRRATDIVICAVREAMEHCNTVVDLGAGYGYLLHQLRRSFPGKNWIGADASTAATQLAKRLFNGSSDARFYKFNFLEPGSYRFLSAAEPPILIVTQHAIEQLPSTARVFDALGQYQDLIHRVFHFEPVYAHQDDTMLSLMRRRFIENQDYNRDLLCEIRRRDEIRLLNEQANVIAINPLNPTSIVQWEYVK
ncbi:MAG: hypothetical protein IH830_09715 [Planctomycetes bacterium]|nr:hypothetical protein [Planctomycetota bacterium]